MNNKYACIFSFNWNPPSLLFLLLFSISIFSQSPKDSIKACEVKSLPDLFKKKDSLLTIKSQLNKTSFFLVIPIIGSSPATGFLYGGVAQYTFKGKYATDKY